MYFRNLSPKHCLGLLVTVTFNLMLLLQPGSIFFPFQYLFQCDHVLYTIVPVSGKEDLERAFVENAQGVCQLNIGRALNNISLFRLVCVVVSTGI